MPCSFPNRTSCSERPGNRERGRGNKPASARRENKRRRPDWLPQSAEADARPAQPAAARGGEAAATGRVRPRRGARGVPAAGALLALPRRTCPRRPPPRGAWGGGCREQAMRAVAACATRWPTHPVWPVTHRRNPRPAALCALERGRGRDARCGGGDSSGGPWLQAPPAWGSPCAPREAAPRIRPPRRDGASEEEMGKGTGFFGRW